MRKCPLPRSEFRVANVTALSLRLSETRSVSGGFSSRAERIARTVLLLPIRKRVVPDIRHSPYPLLAHRIQQGPLQPVRPSRSDVAYPAGHHMTSVLEV